MTTSRRTVLRGAVVLAASAAVPTALASPAAGSTRTIGSAARLRAGTFEPYVGTTFTLGRGLRLVRAELVEVRRDRSGSETRFSLQFRITGRARPVDRIYQLSHDRLPTTPLYVGRVGPAKAGIYEAVVNS